MRVTPPDAVDDAAIVYLHGGAFALGSARAGASLAAEVALRTGVAAYSVGYRLAPEHPYPAALDDVIAVHRALLETLPAERIAIVGESAGGGLALAVLLALRDRGIPMPTAALVLSPWADLTLSGGSIRSRAETDAALAERGLRTRAADYAGTAPLDDPLLSPVFGDFTGLPPLMVQVGGDEILLDDAVRVAARAAADQVFVALQAYPHMPHVFQGFASDLDDAVVALDHAGRFLAGHLPAVAADRTGA